MPKGSPFTREERRILYASYLRQETPEQAVDIVFQGNASVRYVGALFRQFRSDENTDFTHAYALGPHRGRFVARDKRIGPRERMVLRSIYDENPGIRQRQAARVMHERLFGSSRLTAFSASGVSRATRRMRYTRKIVQRRHVNASYEEEAAFLERIAWADWWELVDTDEMPIGDSKKFGCRFPLHHPLHTSHRPLRQKAFGTLSSEWSCCDTWPSRPAPCLP